MGGIHIDNGGLEILRKILNRIKRIEDLVVKENSEEALLTENTRSRCINAQELWKKAKLVIKGQIGEVHYNVCVNSIFQ